MSSLKSLLPFISIKHVIFCATILLSASKLQAQTVKNKMKSAQHNSLYQFGIADAFVNGLYEPNLSLDALKMNGDFGIGAPGMLDGELTVYKGKAYQTKATGETKEAPSNVGTALAFVTFFKADTTFSVAGPISQKVLYAQLDNYMKNKNGMYAVRITGNFDYVKTRAFPPVTQGPYPVLSTILDRQHFFEFKQQKGVMVGFRMPPYLAGINIDGYHFHFLNDALNAGGHILGAEMNHVQVEIAELKDFRLEVPKDKPFMEYNFKNANKPELEKVEKGH